MTWFAVYRSICQSQIPTYRSSLFRHSKQVLQVLYGCTVPNTVDGLYYCNILINFSCTLVPFDQILLLFVLLLFSVKVFKRLFHEGLNIQKERIRDLRKYAKEQRQERAKRQKLELDALEN